MLGITPWRTGAPILKIGLPDACVPKPRDRFTPCCPDRGHSMRWLDYSEGVYQVCYYLATHSNHSVDRLRFTIQQSPAITQSIDCASVVQTVPGRVLAVGVQRLPVARPGRAMGLRRLPLRLLPILPRPPTRTVRGHASGASRRGVTRRCGIKCTVHILCLYGDTVHLIRPFRGCSRSWRRHAEECCWRRCHPSWRGRTLVSRYILVV